MFNKTDKEIMIETIEFVGGALLIIFMFISVPLYYSSCRSAKIYNDKYGTEYTCGDFLWAKDQINSQTQTINLE